MAVLPTALLHGALLCAWMTFIILASLRHDPRIWQDDAPKSIQAQLGPMSPATRRRRVAWALLMLVGLVYLAARLMNHGMPETSTLRERLLAAFVMFELFNLYDALIIDVGVLLLWAPDWAFPPGIKGHPALRERSFHLRAFATGVLAGVPFAAIVVGVWAAIRVMY